MSNNEYMLGAYDVRYQENIDRLTTDPAQGWGHVNSQLTFPYIFIFWGRPGGTTKGRFEYKLAGYDMRQAGAQERLAEDASADNAWEHANSSLMYPYIYVLWERAVAQKNKEDESGKQEEPKPEPEKAKAGSDGSK